VHEALDPFVEARLLVSGERLEVAHEAILTKWARLFGWLMASREPLRLRKKLAVEYHDWVQYGRSESELLQGALLEGVLEKVNLERLPEEQRAFVIGSRERRDRLAQREVEQERELRKLAEARTRSERRGKLVAMASAGVVGVFAIFSGLLWRNAEVGEIKALLSQAQAQFVNNRSSLDTLVAALKADERRRQSIWARFDSKLKPEALQVLQQASYWVRETNRLEGVNGHKDWVQSVSVSPQGDLIATASFDNTVKLWDLQGNLKYTLPHDAEITQVIFHPTQNLIITGSLDKTVRLWNLEGKPIGSPMVNTNKVRSISFDPNTQTIAAACNNGDIQFWNLQGKLQSGFPGLSQNPWKPHGKERINSIDFSPDGKILAVADINGNAKLWNRQGKEIQVLKGHKPGESINRIRFSPDGSTIATASLDGTAILWDVKTGTLRTKLIGVGIGKQSGIQDIIFHPTKFSSEQNPILTTVTIATASLDGTVSLWSSKGNLIETLSGHSSRVNSVSFSPDGNTLISGSNDTIPRLWRVNNLALEIIADHQESVYDIAISPDKQSIASSAGGNEGVKLFNQGRNLKSWPADYILESASNINGDRFLLFGGNPKDKIRIFDWTGGKEGTDIPTLESVRYISFIDQNNIVLINYSDKAQAWNSGKKKFESFGNEKSNYQNVRFSRDGKLIAIIDDMGNIEIYNLSRQLLRKIQTNDVGIKDLRFTFDNQKIVAAGQTGNISLWELDGKYSPPFGSSNATISKINFRPNGDIISASDDKIAVLWTQSGQLITKFVGHTGPVNSTVFSADGETLVTTSSDGKIILWHDVDQMLDIEKRYSQGCYWLKDYLGLRKSKVDLCH
jgi:WD40 repeat protein